MAFWLDYQCESVPINVNYYNLVNPCYSKNVILFEENIDFRPSLMMTCTWLQVIMDAPQATLDPNTTTNHRLTFIFRQTNQRSVEIEQKL